MAGNSFLVWAPWGQSEKLLGQARKPPEDQCGQLTGTRSL